MISGAFPVWLLKRAHETRSKRIVTVLMPKDDTSPCAYLLDLPSGEVEFHLAEDAATGVEAATVVFSRKDAADFIGKFVGALTGRNAGSDVPEKIDV